MDKVIAREVLVVSAVALLAAALLWLAGFVGVAFMGQTYLWSLGLLYGLRILVWALKTVRSSHKNSAAEVAVRGD